MVNEHLIFLKSSVFCLSSFLAQWARHVFTYRESLSVKRLLYSPRDRATSKLKVTRWNVDCVNVKILGVSGDGSYFTDQYNSLSFDMHSTHRWRVTHICVNKQLGHHCLWPVRFLASIWINAIIIVKCAIGNIFRWNLNQNTTIFLQENQFENVVCKTTAILPRPQCVFHAQRKH